MKFKIMNGSHVLPNDEIVVKGKVFESAQRLHELFPERFKLITTSPNDELAKAAKFNALLDFDETPENPAEPEKKPEPEETSVSYRKKRVRNGKFNVIRIPDEKVINDTPMTAVDADKLIETLLA